MTPRWSRVDRCAWCALAVLPFLWYATPIFGSSSYYAGDLTAQYDPWWSFARERLAEGGFPLWNPYVLGGMPYHVNPENSLFYPLKLLLTLLPFFKAVALLRALDSVVAALGSYVLLRSFGTRPLSAFCGAAMFTFGSFMSYKFLHVPYVNTAVWFPWQLWWLGRLLRRPDVRTVTGLALVTALSFLGGSPGIFLVCQMTLAFFLLAGAVRLAAAARWRRLGRAALGVAVATALVVGLTLVLLAPAYDFIQSTPRAGGVGAGAETSRYVLTGRGLAALLVPAMHYDLGAPYPPLYPIPYLNVPFVGLAGVLLALFNLGSRRYAHRLPVALAIVAFGTLLAQGPRAGVLSALRDLFPLLGWFRWPHDYLLMVYLVLPLLAATGLDRLLRADRRTRRRLFCLAAAYLACGLPWLGLWTGALQLSAGLGACALGAWCGTRRPRLAARLAGAGLVALLLADLFTFGFDYRLYVRRNRLEHARDDPALEFVRSHAGIDRVAAAAPALGPHFRHQERIFARRMRLWEEPTARHRELTDLDGWLRRVHPRYRDAALWARRATSHDTDELFRDYPVNAAMNHRYQEVSGYDPFMLERVSRLFRELPQTRTWELFGVRFVVTPHSVVHDRLRPAFDGARWHVYETRSRFPRVAVPAAMEDGLDETELVKRLGGDFDPRLVVLLENRLPGRAGAVAEANSTGAAAGVARIVEYEPERVVVEARLDRDGFLVLHDVYDPGWSARADGRELTVYRANGAFRAVRLPAGTHRVEFRYRPRSFYAAAAVSAGTWLLCCCSFLLGPTARRLREIRLSRWNHVETARA